MEALKKEGKSVLSGEDAFRLYDTYGFPKDLTEEILEENRLTMDAAGFDAALKAQKEMSRGARKVSNYMGKDASVFDEIDAALTTEFVGYDRYENASEISVLIRKSLDDASDYGAFAETLEEGETGAILVPETAFYGTMGGQESDFGVITSETGVFEVKEAIHLQGGKVAHLGTVASGYLSIHDKVSLKVDETNRRNTCENHSATHLLQKALRLTLGDHVEQKGSLNNADRLRFDFSHFQAISKEDLKKIETIVNDEIKAHLPVETKIMSIEDAKKSGAMALFGEKYGSEVRVVSMGGFSVELCGGTHVANTGDIKLFKILSESGISAGVRRIEAITGDRVIAYYEKLEQRLEDASEELKTSPDKLSERIQSLLAETKRISQENEKLKAQLSNAKAGDLMREKVSYGEIDTLVACVPGTDMNGLRNMTDSLKNDLKAPVLVLFTSDGEKVSLVVSSSDEAIAKGVKAGDLVRSIAPIVGGGGGGKPNFAQAGGKDPSAIGKAVEEAKRAIASILGA